MRASPSSTSLRASHSSSTSHRLGFPDEYAGSSDRAGPSISFGAPADDGISITASEDELGSGEDDSAALPPSGRVALPESDPELTTMLSRAAESIGLHYRPPPSPERSRLDDWFLGAQAERRQPPPVPFFPEVHEEVTRSWKAPFSARNRPSASSVLTTLDGGAAQGYVEVPPVERAIAMQLCPQGAAAWRGNPRLPSRACKFSSALTAKAYGAAGQAASALHAMALLQVHQAKALKQLHEGDADPGVLQELRTATDLALRATKVTARALGQTMSTLVVQERHLWLTLADMRESDKHRFMDSPLQRWLHDRVPRWAWRHGTYRVSLTPSCRRTFSPWSDLAFLRAGVPLEQVSRHVVVSTDASATGWGAMCNGHATAGLWTGPQLQWHINCLELLAVWLAMRRFRTLLHEKHILVRSDNTATVAYINHQGGLRSRRMSQLARHLLLWSQKHLRSLRAVHVPGELNRAADELSRQHALPGEWRLHPEVLQLIWRHFGDAQVDLFASRTRLTASCFSPKPRYRCTGMHARQLPLACFVNTQR